ncbi:hypothetical protein NE237_026789 [Protea cynaroides]|uniref:Uncharacterized protein n=1 Tax=Protea cynaroides TaxID=273540 RepID=A0A9Q0GLB4_9MAGN|nr:hypothetical protein NE237_026789 [Protea cynaroides]
MELHEVVCDDLHARPPPLPRRGEAPAVVEADETDDSEDEDVPVGVLRESGGLPSNPAQVHAMLDDVLMKIRGIQADQKEQAHTVENQIWQMSHTQTTFSTRLDSIQAALMRVGLLFLKGMGKTGYGYSTGAAFSVAMAEPSVLSSSNQVGYKERNMIADSLSRCKARTQSSRVWKSCPKLGGTLFEMCMNAIDVDFHSLSGLTR